MGLCGVLAALRGADAAAGLAGGSPGADSLTVRLIYALRNHLFLAFIRYITHNNNINNERGKP